MQLSEIFLGPTTSFEVWGAYFQDKKFDDEPELRNKLFVVWFGCLIDTVEAGQRFLPQIISEANQHNFSAIAFNAKELIKFSVITARFMKKFSREDQIFLANLRNQYVHGYYSNRHRDSVSIKWCDGDKVVTEKIQLTPFHNLITSFYGPLGTIPLDDILGPFRERAMSESDPYWTAIQIFLQNKHQFVQDIRTERLFEILI